MSTLNINKTKNTPAVHAEIEGGQVLISVVGNTFPENAKQFYAQLIDWLKENANEIDSVDFDADFHYMASSSLICFLDVLRTAIQLVGVDKCSLKWKYEEDDDDILKIGQNFSKILSINIDLIAY
ncbi:MAG: DUF1987 family protein [Flavobacteriales bacterium]|nr:DUF1987 family protein [Flavobacteriales bacterium]